MANEQVLSLFAAQASNANGASVGWAGGEGIFAAWGTFGGGTVTLQFSKDGGTNWYAVDRAGETFVTLTAGGAGLFRMGACLLRAALTGATVPSLSADVCGSRAG